MIFANFCRMNNRQIVRTAFEKCIEAVKPRQIVGNAIQISPNVIRIADTEYTRTPSTSIVLIAFGKASILMADGARDILKAPLLQKTLVVAPEAQKLERGSSEDYEIMFAAKDNLPDDPSVVATRHVISEIQKFDSAHTIFLFLISGGGSALFCSPNPQISLSEKLTTIKLLQASGATIQELNVVRQKMSTVKGGRLLEAIRMGYVASLIVSDVIGDPIGLIASGPTVPRSTVGGEVQKILQTYPDVFSSLPPAVKSLLTSSDDVTSSPPHQNPQNSIICSNATALHAASEYLTTQNCHVITMTSSLSGNATDVGHRFADLITGVADLPAGVPKDRPLALLFGGETTVKLAEHPGRGGRNQEIVLACLDRLKGAEPRYGFCILSAGTDGQDGPTSAAGAMISSEDLLTQSPTSSEALTSSDSFTFWSRFRSGECHVITGPSGTNVMDIQILILMSK